MRKHRELKAWQHCRRLAIEIYRITAEFPSHERFGLTSQLRRAATSAVANIAEAVARMGAGELAHGLSMALGSLAEVDALLDIAEATGSLSSSEHARVELIRDEASRTTFGMQRKVQLSRHSPARL